MLTWLSDLLQTCSLILPRLHLVRSTHRGVLFTLGHHKPVGPGARIFWPVISELVTIPVVRQTLNLPWQSLETSCGQAVCVAVTVVYQISDVEAALTETDNITDTVQDIAHKAVKRVVSESTVDDLKDSRSIDTRLRKRLRVDLRPFGVDVTQAFVSEFSRPCMVRLMGDVVAS